MRCRLVHAS